MKIAVAIPVRDEESSIGQLIDTLLAQTRPPDEIIIADGGSRDRTVQFVEQRIARGAPIKLLRIGAAFPGRGRNEAVRATSCDWIAFIDAGIEADTRWLEQLATYAYEHPDVSAVFGNFEPVTNTFFTRCAALAYVPARQCSGPHSGWRGFSIASSLIRRSAWQDLGGFPEHLRSAEDLRFLSALTRDQTNRFGVVPTAIVHWELADTVRRTLTRFQTYSRYGLIAGYYEGWQRAIVRRYASIAALAWLTGPVAPFTFSILSLSMLGVRAIRSMGKKPEFVERGIASKLLQFSATTGILGLVDYAALRGLASWLWRDVLRINRMTAA